MDKIDKLIEIVGDRFEIHDGPMTIIDNGCGYYYIGELFGFGFDSIVCTVAEYKERLKQKGEENTHEEFNHKLPQFDMIMQEFEMKQQLLETYTGLAMQALIARGESASGVKSLSREFAQAAIDSLNGVCDENTTE